MSHRKKRHGPALTQRTAPLPVLSNQDLKVVFAQEGQAHPQTTVEFQIPLDYDILCAQGCRDWQAQRAITIEQTDITTIKSDALADPSQLRMRAQPVDQFEGLDAKLREIEVEAEAMRKDFDLLDIPEPEERPQVEPLFGPAARSRIVVNEITEPEDELAPVARSAPPLAPPKGMSARTKAETDRARLKLQLAQAALVGDQKAVKRAEEQRKRARQRESLTGRVEWTGIAARIRDEDK